MVAPSLDSLMHTLRVHLPCLYIIESPETIRVWMVRPLERRCNGSSTSLRLIQSNMNQLVESGIIVADQWYLVYSYLRAESSLSLASTVYNDTVKERLNKETFLLLYCRVEKSRESSDGFVSEIFQSEYTDGTETL
jgi:hypothetical protein